MVYKNMGTISESLLQFAVSYQSCKLGISIEDFANIPYSTNLESLISQGLSSGDSEDQRLALFFCEGLLHIQRNAPKYQITEMLMPRIESFLCSKEPSVRLASYTILPHLKRLVSDYQGKILLALRDENPQIRTLALNLIESFMGKNEVKHITTFEFDDYIAETSPAGPLRYVLRDHAFLLIEKYINQVIPKREKVEMYHYEPVYWFDWTPLLASLKCEPYRANQ